MDCSLFTSYCLLISDFSFLVFPILSFLPALASQQAETAAWWSGFPIFPKHEDAQAGQECSSKEEQGWWGLILTCKEEDNQEKESDEEEELSKAAFFNSHIAAKLLLVLAPLLFNLKGRQIGLM